MNKVLWLPISFIAEPPEFCEAPRHIGLNHKATYWFALLEYNCVHDARRENVTEQGMCDECMGIIASEMGTTAHRGAMEFLKVTYPERRSH